jgi:phage shock protein C
MKQLYKSQKNRVIAGVFGGFGEYFNVDPVIIRVLFIFLLFFTGVLPGVLAYIVAAMIIPNHGATINVKSKVEEPIKTEEKPEQKTETTESTTATN